MTAVWDSESGWHDANDDEAEAVGKSVVANLRRSVILTETEEES